MNKLDYKGVWVFAEQRGAKLQKVSLELLGKGRDISDKLGVKLTAVLLGSGITDISKELMNYGADEVIVCDHELLKNYTTDGYTKVICELVEKYKPEVFLIGASFIGRDLGPRVAARLSTGLTADCTGLDIDSESKNLMMTRPAFGGNLMATIECAEHRPQMATVRPGVFERLKKDESRTGSIEFEKIDLTKEDIRTEVIEIVKTAKDMVDIGEAEIIVSGGRGIGNKENFALLKELAEAMGGVVGASRAAVDNGWMDKVYQVGQTGKTVRPKVYIACGISGAIQHLAGMQDSDYIVAINKDPEAPIMKAADLAIVGDFTKVIPELINKVKEVKN
ncbi:electron transfer flavoprotein subunit alpha/FixB family protein [Clostridium sp. YIM B02515]|uniref:Electron transfer flavoprotein subunit alpha/FixB family protein n=1 Tax=Clostridium rhizosphaerae TaxID=2803861 RepID=A0ABS1TEQ0_9CLOT|nr:electron transfer flavoprotein subunit alpha/FixB family protein [Clostridium rhizosphaerae]MBL4937222.1 electron transfer flavoprotein subunit alpha/FixB family protein [Clostridium rhizosphaerae]